jgi:hypothetical protein
MRRNNFQAGRNKIQGGRNKIKTIFLPQIELFQSVAPIPSRNPLSPLASARPIRGARADRFSRIERYTTSSDFRKAFVGETICPI